MIDAREWGGYAFQQIAALAPERDSDGRVIEFMPQERYAKRETSKLHPYGSGPFCRFRVGWGYPVPGVYVITCVDRPVYVGECLSLSERFSRGYGSIQPRNCYEGGQRTNCRINNLVLLEARDGRTPQLWFHQTNEDRKRIESELIRTLRPIWNAATGRLTGPNRSAREYL